MAEQPEGADISLQPRRGASGMLAAELRGDLRCARCRYNLRGLSVTGPCPECGTPIRATLLLTVDPMAAELRPVRAPFLTAYGLQLWTGAALLAGLMVWWLRVADLLGQPGWTDMPWMRIGIVVCAAASGVGAIALVCPHEGASKRARWLALAGCLLYLPLCLFLHRLHVVVDAAGPAPYGLSVLPRMDRSVLRLCELVTLTLILLCLRPNARLLAARSVLMRTGRVDRQTMAGMLGVLGVLMLGDVLILSAGGGRGPIEDILRQIGQLVVLIGSMLFSLGLVGMVVDSWRLRGVILEPPLSLEQLLRPATEVQAGRSVGEARV